MSNDRAIRDINDIVSRWANLKLSWQTATTEPALWRPGSSRLNDATIQTNALSMELAGVLGIHDPLWWDSLAELANIVKSKVQR